jgi:hypothetical protein
MNRSKKKSTKAERGRQMAKVPEINERLAQARSRGRAVREKMKLAEGGSITTAEVAVRLGLSEAVVLEQCARGRLLAWREGRARILRFPVWQFQGDQLLAGLKEVLKVLNRDKRLDDFGRIGFFLCTFGRLDGLRPLDCLRTNRKDKALLAAQAYVE